MNDSLGDRMKGYENAVGSVLINNMVSMEDMVSSSGYRWKVLDEDVPVFTEDRDFIKQQIERGEFEI